MARTDKCYIGTNTKMYKGIQDTLLFLKELNELTKDLSRKELELFVIPSFITLDSAVRCIPAENISIGAQNMCWEDNGQFTGEISPIMLKEVGVKIVEIGHSERRHVLHETDIEENKKVLSALHHGFTPLLCVGETLEQKDWGIAEETIRRQLKLGLRGVTSSMAQQLWIAYEPVWAIGTSGVPATKEYADKKHKLIKQTLAELFGKEIGWDIPVLYGGSVNSENATELIQMPHIDGLFIGRSAWNARNFSRIIQNVLPIFLPTKERRNSMIPNQLFSLHEEIHNKDFILATYYIELDSDSNVISKASSMAIGQTVGTWVPVPGITDEMRENHMGRVVNIIDVPPIELSSQHTSQTRTYLIQIAYPNVNFEASFPMILTTLLGNDASTSAQVKLVDLQFPKSLSEQFVGPKFGIEGLRKLTGVEDRPLVLNMIKPCIGFSPQVGAKIFYETALGGVDFIKDDELLGNPEFCRAEERVRFYNEAAKAVFEKTGHKTRYIVNVTERADRQLDHVKRVVDAGAELIMLNFAAVGYSMFQAVSESVPVPVLGHYASSGMFYEGKNSGMTSPLAIGKFPRLAGADIVMMNTPYGGYPLEYLKYIRTAHELSLPYYNLKPTFPSLGGGVHPGQAELFINDLGTDIILAPGGSIQGHPDGATAGARAMRQAIDAVLQGISIEEAAKEHTELGKAIHLWGVKKVNK
ncbi:triose-phosphate isomerase [Pullulanibacillus sp. KACC 23026]|uniref:triose-phosphate isomerase n=1 Tax=Pullulanibacillus sp. KACC 23026 TaxID=3028315 RepID=UPI0023B163D8|nr:triose-phosphate isomerase [Pullulanibacillus sp. KACC 23026]WEG13397.1 triose-phosphate isomerase [Pullulanibacillus sp. KACC 23026]